MPTTTLFDDDLVPGSGADFFARGSSVVSLSAEGEPALGSASLKVLAGRYSQAGIETGRSIDADSQFLQFDIYRTPGADGHIVLRYGSNWLTLKLTDENYGMWTVDGLESAESLESLPEGEWSHVTIDLLALLGAGSYLGAVGVIGYSDGGDTYYMDNVVIGDSAGPTNAVPTGAATAVLVNGIEDVATDIAAADLLAGFSDADGDALSVANLAASAGAIVDNGDGTFTLTTPADFNGVVTLSYDVEDGQGGAAPAVQTLTIDATNDAPVVAAPIADQGGEQAAAFSFVVPVGTFSDIDGDTLSLTATLANGDPLPAWLSFNAVNGTFSGTPEANDVGLISLRVTADDGAGGSTFDDFELDVTPPPPNTVPVATGDSYTTDEDTVLTIPATGVLANDVDGDADPLSAVLVTGPANGVLGLNADGSFSYMPDANFNGTDSFVYVANDGEDASAETTVTLTVNPVNDNPVGTPTTVIADGLEDTVVVMTMADLTDGMSDPDGTQIIGYGNFSATAGVLTTNPETGNSELTLPADFFGEVVMSYEVVDSNGGQTLVSQSVNILPVNDAPVVDVVIADQVAEEAVAFSFVVPVGTFSDVDGDALTLSATLASGDPLPAWLNFDPLTGELSGIPETSDLGVISIRVTADDGNGETVFDDFELNIVDVPPPNAAPVGNTDTYVVDEDTLLTVPALGVLANDTDVNGDVLTAAVVTGPANGTLNFNADGSFTYTPDANFNGSDSFTYLANDGEFASVETAVTLTVNSVNDAPVVDVIIADQAVEESAAFAFSVPAGTFSDVDGDALALTATLANGDPLPAWLNFNPATGAFSGTPGALDVGLISVRVTADDGAGATVFDDFDLDVTVGPPPNAAPVANADAYTTDEDVPLTIPALGVLGNDTDADGDALTASVVTGPANGVLSLTADGSFTYTPNADFNGTDSFTYSASDGEASSAPVTATITVNAVDEPLPPTGVFVFDDAFQNGADFFVRGSSEASISVAGEPAMGAASLKILAGRYSQSGVEIGRSLDADTGFLQFDIYRTPGADGHIVLRHGSGWSSLKLTDENYGLWTVEGMESAEGLESLPEGEWSHVTVDLVSLIGAGNYLGAVTVIGYSNGGDTYYLDNVVLTSSPGPGNDYPTGVPSAVLADGVEDVATVVAATDLLAGFSDSDGDVLSVANLVASVGTIANNGDGTFTLTTPADFNGGVTLSYDVVDGLGGSIAAVQSLNINPANDAPVVSTGIADQGAVDAAAFSFVVPGNAFVDVDGDVLGLTATLADGDPLPTWLSFNPATGTFSGTPGTTDIGVISVRVTADDGNGATVFDDFDLDVTAVPPPNAVPVANADVYTTDEDVALTITPVLGVLGNDTDADGDTLTASVVSGPANGSLSLNADGSFTYTPNTDFNGTDSFTYAASDGADASAPTSVTITVNPVDEPPVTEGVPLFVDGFDPLNGVDFFVRGSSTASLSTSGEPALGAISLKVTPGAYSQAGLELGRRIDADTDFLQLDVYRTAGANGDLVLRHGNGWSTLKLNDSNYGLWTVEGMESADGLESLPVGEWSHITVDLAALIGTDGYLGAVTVIGYTSGGATFYIDNVQLTATEAWSTPEASGTAFVEPLWTEASGFTTPESAHFDPDTGAIFVTDTNGGFVAKLDASGAVVEQNWLSGLTEPKGIVIQDGLVYVATATDLIIADSTTGAIVATHAATSSVSFNDVSVGADGSVYVSNIAGAEIWRLKDGVFDVFVSDIQLTDVNGIYVDGDRLLAGSIGSGVLYEIDLATKAVSALAEGFGQLDGIERVSEGLWLISSFSGQVYLYSEEDDTSTLLLNSSGSGNTADIGYDPVTQTVLVPSYTGNGVAAYKLHLPDSGGAAAPIILDLEGDGFGFVPDVAFDFDADGVLEVGAWAGAGDAFLALDRNGDGVINDISEISFLDDLPGAQTDLEGLRAFDDNQDGVLSSEDAAFDEFLIWTDANGDGVSTSDELHTLDEAGVVSIDLVSDGTSYTDVSGVQVHGETLVTMADGTQVLAGDVSLSYTELAADNLSAMPVGSAEKLVMIDSASDSLDLSGVQAFGAASGTGTSGDGGQAQVGFDADIASFVFLNGAMHASIDDQADFAGQDQHVMQIAQIETVWSGSETSGDPEPIDAPIGFELLGPDIFSPV